MILDFEGIHQVDSTIIMSFLFGIVLCFQFIEGGCYFLFYNHLYKHNRLMLNNSIISSDAYRNRQRTNILSMGGQLCCFLFELVSVSNLIIWINIFEKHYVTSMKEIYFVLKLCEFGFLSTIQVFTSRELYNLLKSFIKIKIW